MFVLFPSICLLKCDSLSFFIHFLHQHSSEEFHLTFSNQERDCKRDCLYCLGFTVYYIIRCDGIAHYFSHIFQMTFLMWSTHVCVATFNQSIASIGLLIILIDNTAIFYIRIESSRSFIQEIIIIYSWDLLVCINLF